MNMNARFLRLLLCISWLSVTALGRGTAAETAADPTTPNPDSLQRWQAMRFGMFIHWGPVSLRGTEIGWSRGAKCRSRSMTSSTGDLTRSTSTQNSGPNSRRMRG